jgi:hypothetical protein
MWVTWVLAGGQRIELGHLMEEGARKERARGSG